MTFHYPNGKRYIETKQTSSPVKRQDLKKWSYGKRGMTLEEDINQTNQYYLDKGIAVIHKKPTPVQIVNVDYPKRSAAVIKEAYFKQASTTDYNGVYKGKYLDFEAKETKLPSSFPLKNFHEHQIDHMKKVLKQNGICFVVIRFSLTEEVFFLEAVHLLTFWDRMLNGGRKSITKEEIVANGYLIPLTIQPRIDFIKIINDIYPFHED
ncbi:Holliday junction resolvase RecU [Bacillus benzoevorans]|uniref:Holliday junction resolvase RecU n=1 Tax=Bacillus benzoevorans TaxID=1456 RepID=A0A7X0HS37_9BACI|nr:Holliday junction resolvase RecU [Bacillus benzoevorans]MBB6444665.1 recombination protein U [Bacillus benzoevorans]